MPPRTLAAVVPAVAGKALGKKGLAFGALITDWDSIVGPTLGQRTVPQKLTFPPGERERATLTLMVIGAYALDVQHSQPQIIERINSFFGYKAVERLKIVQGSLPQLGKTKPRRRALTPVEEAAINAHTAQVEDEALREALTRLGQSLVRRGNHRP